MDTKIINYEETLNNSEEMENGETKENPDIKDEGETDIEDEEMENEETKEDPDIKDEEETDIEYEEMENEETKEDPDIKDEEDTDTEDEDEIPPTRDFTTNDRHSTGKKVERIIGTRFNETEELMYLVKWQNIDEPEFILAAEAEKRYPQEIIQYFQNQICFKGSSFIMIKEQK